MGESGQGLLLLGRDNLFITGQLFRWLGDASILATTNKWRKERGLPEVSPHLLDRRQEGTA